MPRAPWLARSWKRCGEGYPVFELLLAGHDGIAMIDIADIAMLFAVAPAAASAITPTSAEHADADAGSTGVAVDRELRR